MKHFNFPPKRNNITQQNNWIGVLFSTCNYNSIFIRFISICLGFILNSRSSLFNSHLFGINFCLSAFWAALNWWIGGFCVCVFLIHFYSKSISCIVFSERWIFCVIFCWSTDTHTHKHTRIRYIDNFRTFEILRMFSEPGIWIQSHSHSFECVCMLG